MAHVRAGAVEVEQPFEALGFGEPQHSLDLGFGSDARALIRRTRSRRAAAAPAPVEWVVPVHVDAEDPTAVVATVLAPEVVGFPGVRQLAGVGIGGDRDARLVLILVRGVGDPQRVESVPVVTERCPVARLQVVELGEFRVVLLELAQVGDHLGAGVVVGIRVQVLPSRGGDLLEWTGLLEDEDQRVLGELRSQSREFDSLENHLHGFPSGFRRRDHVIADYSEFRKSSLQSRCPAERDADRFTVFAGVRIRGGCLGAAGCREADGQSEIHGEAGVTHAPMIAASVARRCSQWP